MQQQPKWLSPIEALTKQFVFSNMTDRLVSPAFDSVNKSPFENEVNLKNIEPKTDILSSTDKSHNPLSYLNNSLFNEHSQQDVEKLSQRQGFRLSDLNLMIPYEAGNQISEIPKVYPIPNAPIWFLGISNINGMTIPIFDVKKFLNIKDKENSVKQAGHIHLTKNRRPMLLVLQHEENATGILIDGLSERLDFSESQMLDNSIAPKLVAQDVLGSYLINDEIWFDLDSLGFLNSIEKNLLAG